MDILSFSSEFPDRNIIFIDLKIDITCTSSVKIRIGSDSPCLTPAHIFEPSVFMYSSSISIGSESIWLYDSSIHCSSHILCNSCYFEVFDTSESISHLPQYLDHLFCWHISGSFSESEKSSFNLRSSSFDSSETIGNSESCIVMVMTRKGKTIFISQILSSPMNKGKYFSHIPRGGTSSGIWHIDTIGSGDDCCPDGLE